MNVSFLLDSQKISYLDNLGTITVEPRASLRKKFASVKLPLMSSARCKDAIEWCKSTLSGRCLYPNLVWPKELEGNQHSNVELFFERKSDAMLFKLKWC